MSIISIKQKGNLRKFKVYCKTLKEIAIFNNAERVAIKCIEELKEVTPKNTGLTSESWSYDIIKTKNKVQININNTNIQNGVNVAILLQYDHVNGSNYLIKGINYIEPAVKKAYDEILNNAWEEAVKA